MNAFFRSVATLLVTLSLMLSAAYAEEYDWQKIYPDHYYSLSEATNSNLEARSDGRLSTNKVSAGRGQCWQFKPLGDNCFIVTNALLGPHKCLTIRNGKPLMVAAAPDQKLRVFNYGDKFLFKIPKPGDDKRGPTGDLVTEPVGAVYYTLQRMQSLKGPAPTAGNYYSNEGKVQGTVSSGSLQAGSLWEVVAPGLSGREKPDAHSRQVTTFKRGTLLQANNGRGGSDEVLLNAVDSNGNTWMPVRTRDGLDLHCYVRANSRYIRPLTK